MTFVAQLVEIVMLTRFGHQHRNQVHRNSLTRISWILKLDYIKCTSYIDSLIYDFGSGECRTIGGQQLGGPNLPCIFPFKYKDKIYNECHSDTYGVWCSTKIDATGKHVTGHWGFCGQGCPGVPGM